MTTRNPFTNYAQPPLSRDGDQRGGDSIVTTMAIGEEGGSSFCRPPVTTLAIGEESGSGPLVPAQPVSALSQVFHLSPQFRELRFETRDWRCHPLLGGISSTRWNAWTAFTESNPQLAFQLADRSALPLLRQLVAKPGTPLGPLPSLDAEVEAVVGSRARLPTRGILSGDDRTNRLVGSKGQDVLLGWGGDDRLIGRGGGDLLSGGEGADRFFFSLTPSRAARNQPADTITDFSGSDGDRLVIRGLSSYRGLLPFSGVAGELRFSPGLLEADQNGDGVADRQIRLPGVSELRPEWLIAAGP
jgi:hypothetical protein